MGFSILENAAAAAAAADTSSSTNTSSSTIFTVYSKLEYPVYYKMENTGNIVVGLGVGVGVGVSVGVGVGVSVAVKIAHQIMVFFHSGKSRLKLLPK